MCADSVDVFHRVALCISEDLQRNRSSRIYVCTCMHTNTHTQRERERWEGGERETEIYGKELRNDSPNYAGGQSQDPQWAAGNPGEQMQEKSDVPLPRQSGSRNSLLLGGRSAFVFHLDPQLTGWSPSEIAGSSALLSLWISMFILSRNSLTGTPRILFDQISQHPVTPSGRHIRVTITSPRGDCPVPWSPCPGVRVCTGLTKVPTEMWTFPLSEK